MKDQTLDNDRIANLRCAFEDILGIPFTEGNSVNVLRNGDEIFPAMLEAIAGARSSIEFLTFIYWTGDIARRMAHALADKAKAGVVVRVVLDGFGAKPMRDDLVEMMRASGVHIRWFRPLATWRLWSMDNRTHRKVLVVDGEVGFTGGVGIAEEWEGDARDETEWRDTHFRLRGPVVSGLRGAFYGNWAEIDRKVAVALPNVRHHEAAGEVWMQVLRTTASIAWSDIASMLELIVAQAQERLRIATPYFAPDGIATELLQEAMDRGVEVDVIIPGPHVDRRATEIASTEDYLPLLEAGLRVWTYQPTMMHTKVVTVDGLLAQVGSANFNQRSMRKDDELAVIVLDRGTVATLDRQFDEDLARCHRVGMSEMKNRGLLRRLGEVVLRPVRSQT